MPSASCASRAIPSDSAASCNDVATSIDFTSMPAPLTADDLLPLIAKLSAEERRRLLHLVFRQSRTDAEAYAAQPVQPDEFVSDDEALAWDAEGWEGVG